MTTTAGPGRPRLTEPRRPGQTAREEILDAAAELFTEKGYAATSTRAIAESVGIRQASLYHHFSTKHEILDALLADTVRAPQQFAEQLGGFEGPATELLYTLMLFDAVHLSSGRWNLGALYLLPVIRSADFAGFRAERSKLMDAYRELALRTLDELTVPQDWAAPREALAGLPFRLVESVINERSDNMAGDHAPLHPPRLFADTAIRMLGYQGSVDDLYETAEKLIAAIADDRAEAPVAVSA